MTAPLASSMTTVTGMKPLCDLRQPLQCLITSALVIPNVAVSLLRFRDPHSDRLELLRQTAGAEDGGEAAWGEQLERAIAALPPAATAAPQALSQLGCDSFGFLYQFPLSPWPCHHQFFAVTHDRLSSSQEQRLREVAAAIANYLEVWQQRHLYQSKTTDLEGTLGSVEHQVRQSLGLVNLYLSALEEQPLDAEGTAMTDSLRTTVTEIVERLSTILSSPDQPMTTLPVVDLRQLVGDRGRTFAPSLQAKQLTLNIPEETVWLQAEPHQLGQVIDNLLCNAIAFSPLGGCIAWTWEGFDGEALIQIADQGPGIPAGAGQTIFQPGYTQRPNGQGLGLAIVHKIVRQHGGRIWANNLAQGGAQFSVIFPQTPRLQS